MFFASSASESSKTSSFIVIANHQRCVVGQSLGSLPPQVLQLSQRGHLHIRAEADGCEAL